MLTLASASGRHSPSWYAHPVSGISVPSAATSLRRSSTLVTASSLEHESLPISGGSFGWLFSVLVLAARASLAGSLDGNHDGDDDRDDAEHQFGDPSRHSRAGPTRP